MSHYHPCATLRRHQSRKPRTTVPAILDWLNAEKAANEASRVAVVAGRKASRVTEPPANIRPAKDSDIVVGTILWCKEELWSKERGVFWTGKWYWQLVEEVHGYSDYHGKGEIGYQAFGCCYNNDAETYVEDLGKRGRPRGKK